MARAAPATSHLRKATPKGLLTLQHVEPLASQRAAAPRGIRTLPAARSSRAGCELELVGPAAC